MAIIRLRRLRRTLQIREIVSQTRLLAEDLIMPYFVIGGKNKREPIESMPGVCRLSIDNLVEDIKEAKTLGIMTILLFGICNKKDVLGSEAYFRDGIVQKAIRAIKRNIKDIILITDVCLCGYTSHGHCGVIKQVDGLSFMVVSKKRTSHKLSTINYKPELDNDATLEVLAKIALSHAEAGVDFVAPSAMMDGQVRMIREALDRDGFKDIGIFSYSAKYASNFYGPFREALDSSPSFGDRKSYQMDYRNSDEALREIEEDLKEGADIVMVKPALAYLDIIYRAKQKFGVPIAAYNVSGEYAMVKAYCKKPETRAQKPSLFYAQDGSASVSEAKPERELVLEILTSIKRAGADLIVTYYAKEVARWLKVVDS